MGSLWRITALFVRFGRADQNSSVLMDAGCWLCFTALFSSFALSGRKPPPHFFTQSSPWLARNTLWVFQDAPSVLIFNPTAFLPSPPPLLHRSSKRTSYLPAKLHWESTAGTTIHFLLPRKRYFSWKTVPNTLTSCVKVFVVTLRLDKSSKPCIKGILLCLSSVVELECLKWL